MPKYVPVSEWLAKHDIDDVQPTAPWCCPWCGEDDANTIGVPEDRRNIQAHSVWLEAHVMECEPWLKENGEWLDG